jgi:ATP-binding cassette, subfamily B, bacterial
MRRKVPNRFQRIVKAHRRRVKGGLCLAALCALGYTLAELLAPWPLKIIFDHAPLEKSLPPSLAILNGALQSGKSSAIVTISFGILLIAAFKGAFAYTQLYLTSRIGHQMVYTLRRELFAHLQRPSLSFYKRARSGELLTKVTSDTNTLKDVFSESALSFVSQLLTLVGMFTALFLLNWRLSLIVTATFPILCYTIFTIYRRIKASARKQREREGRLAPQINEALGSTLLVRAFAREGYEQQRFDGVEANGLNLPAGALRRARINRNPYSAEFRRPGKSRVEVYTEDGSFRHYRGKASLEQLPSGGRHRRRGLS